MDRGHRWSTQVVTLMLHVRDLLVELTPSVELSIGEEQWEFDFGGPVVHLLPRRRHVDLFLRAEPSIASALVAEFSSVAQTAPGDDGVLISIRTPERSADTQVRAICRKFLLAHLESNAMDDDFIIRSIPRSRPIDGDD